ncbi:hypothetical protein HMI54_006382 [Coelomomyces lativittatus]|nr:hypothetical protein HMI56_002812 [Coelomomyces lativittatus]KAJ1517250.1 hypothetical protein HMI54_006382 [Coelomomyces lativittatus]
MGCVTSKPKSALTVQPIQEANLSKQLPASSQSLDKPALPSIQSTHPPSLPLTTTSPSIPSSPVSVNKPTSFEIPIDENIRIKARKPQSAHPGRRSNPKKLAPVHVSNEELLLKLKIAEEAWNASMDTQKHLAPEHLSTLIDAKSMRIAENRAKELEEKKSRLAAHDQHLKLVQKRKRQLINNPALIDTAIHLAWNAEVVCVP